MALGSEGYDPRALGARCDECPLNGKRVIPPAPARARLRLVLVGEAPGRVEEYRGAPFVGPSGNLLDNMLKLVEVKREETYATNAILCRLPHEGKKIEKAARLACLPRLENELAQLPPEVPIVTLGTVPMESVVHDRRLLGRGRGFIWELAEGPLENRKVIPTVHPAFILRGADMWLPVMRGDLKRALRVLDGSAVLHDRCEYGLVADGWALNRALKKLRGAFTAIDIETTGTDTATTRMRCIGLSNGTTTIVVNVDEEEVAEDARKLLYRVIARHFQKRIAVGHNILLFDQPILERYGILLPRVEDTLVAHRAFASHFRQGLDHVTSVFVDSGPWKIRFKRRGAEEKGGSDLYNKPVVDLAPYNAADVRLTALVWMAIPKDLAKELTVYTGDKRVMQMCRSMKETGIEVDQEILERLSKSLRGRANALKGEMRKLLNAPEFSPAKLKDIRWGLFTECRARVLTYTPTGLPGTSSLTLESLKTLPTRAGKLADLILRWRLAWKIRSTYLEPIQFARDGRAHPEWKMGPVSGRLACIAEGTPIDIVRNVGATPSGVPIEQVRAGDLAYCFIAGKLAIRKVLAAACVGRRDVVRITWRSTANHKIGTLNLTGDHRVLKTDGEWVRADSLRPGNRVMALSRRVGAWGYALLQPTGVRKKALREHRFIHAQFTGEHPEHVHHVDGDKLNNVPANLKGMSSAAHGHLHGITCSEELRAKRRAYAHEALIKGRSGLPRTWVKGRTHHRTLKLTKAVMLHALRANEWSLSKAARALGHCRAAFKLNMLAEGLDVEEFKRRALVLKHEGLRQNNHTILDVEPLVGRVNVYDLQIEEAENFIANEVCVHNCQFMTQPRYDPEDMTTRVREIYKAREGYSFIYFDLSQVEMRLAAYFSDDLNFIETCQGNVHSRNAMVIFPESRALFEQDPDGKNPAIAKKFRDIAKNVGFAITYLAEEDKVYAYLLSKGFKVNMKQVRAILRLLRSTYKRYYRYVAENVALCEKQGYLRSVLAGRKRWMGFHPKPTEIANYPIQSGVADIMNVRLPIIQDRAGALGAPLIAQVHDCGVLECPDEKIDAGKQIVRDVWAEPVVVPHTGKALVIPIDLKVGKRFSQVAA